MNLFSLLGSRERDAPEARSVCLVTNELYPFARGGIGRLMSNWIKQNADLGYPVRLHLLLPAELHPEASAIEAFCTPYGVSCHFCQDADLSATRLGQAVRALPDQTWDYLQPYAAAYRYFAALLALKRRGVTFDVIEFPDYGGWGALVIEAKRAGIAFLRAELCVRLHSTYGIIVATERCSHHPSSFSGAMVDLERFALLHADRVIAHQHAILAFNQTFYRFGPAWRSKASVETPPIILDDFETGRDEHPSNRFVFSSRLQPFKRPDLFLRAACLYFTQFPDDDGEAVAVSYGWDQGYIEALRTIIPAHLKHKVRLVLDAVGEERQALLSGAIVVIPSDYESHCLFAYETAAMKRRLLLRRDCLAFGKSEGWVDGENCLMFGSDPADLAEAMRRAVDWSPRSTYVVDADKPYWITPAPPPEPAPHAPVTHHVIVHGLDDAAKIDRAFTLIESLAVHRASLLLAPHIDARTVRQAAAQSGIVAKIGSLTYADSDFGEVWRHAAGSSADIVTFVDADDQADALYVKVAEAAFALRPALDVLTANEALVDARSGRDLGFRPAAGEHLVSGATGLGVVGRLFSIRTRVLASTRFPSEARSFALLSVVSELATAGKGICVLPDIYNVVSSETVVSRDPRWIAAKVGDLSAAIYGGGFGIGLPVAVNAAAPGALAVHRFIASADVPVERLLPLEAQSWGNPVSYNAEHHGILIHPVDDGPTLARLGLPGRGLAGSTFFVEVENASSENRGFHFGVFLGSEGVSDKAMAATMAERVPEGALQVIEPLERRTIYVEADPKVKETRLYLLSAPLPGQQAHRCLAVIRSYGALQR